MAETYGGRSAPLGKTEVVERRRVCASLYGLFMDQLVDLIRRHADANGATRQVEDLSRHLARYISNDV